MKLNSEERRRVNNRIADAESEIKSCINLLTMFSEPQSVVDELTKIHESIGRFRKRYLEK